MSKLQDMTGMTIGKLTVVGRAANDRHGRACWACLCGCGNSVTVGGFNLRSGNTKSCGCEQGGPVHRMIGSKEHVAWVNMKQRCLNPNNPRYSSYGGRGITVCPEWMEFEAFYADMGDCPAANLSIDRINNDKGYEPGNCRWATASEQQRNKRDKY